MAGLGGAAGRKAYLSIRKHDHFTPTREIRRHVRALARNHPEGWKMHIYMAVALVLTIISLGGERIGVRKCMHGPDGSHHDIIIIVTIVIMLTGVGGGRYEEVQGRDGSHHHVIIMIIIMLTGVRGHKSC